MSEHNWTEGELRVLVRSQKRKIYQLIDELDEARDIARQLLYELRQFDREPVTHVGYSWLRDDIGPAKNEAAGGE